MSTLGICLYPFSKDTSLFAIGKDFAHRYINMRRIVYVYILIYKYISCFIKKGGEAFYPVRCLLKNFSVYSSNKGNAYP